MRINKYQMKKHFTLLVFIFACISNAQTVSISSSATGAVCAGTSATFTATTSGITSPTYQWYKNSVAISGETSATYTTNTLSNNDQIRVTVLGASPTVGSITTTGLIAHFDAANYNTSSTRWTDLSTTGNHMDFYTSSTYSVLKTAPYSTDGGGSLNVNNNSVYGKTISNTGISGNGGKTMSAWVKFEATDKDWASVASIGEYAAGKLFEIYAQKNVSSSQLIFHWSGSQLSDYANLSTNSWYYVTIKSDGSSVNYIYINGIQVAYASQTLNITNSPLYMGAPKTYAQGGWDYNLRGKISTLSLYNTALSAQTILDNYNATKGRYETIFVASNIITSAITAAPSATLTVFGDACINKTTLNTPSGLSSYTWYKDNVAISGATTNTFTPTAAGDYKVAVSNGTCSTTSTTTPVYTCGVTADGKMVNIATPGSLLSLEGGANFGTSIDNVGKIINTTGLTTTTGTIGATTAVLGGVISATNSVTSSIGVIYSTDPNFSTSSSSTLQSNVIAGAYTTTITGLTAVTNYYAKSFVVNKAGTSYGPVVSFTTTSPPVTLGSQLQGGTVAYIYQSGDPGYIAGETHGIIMSNNFLNNSQPTRWTAESTPTATGATGTALGTGITNSNTIYSRIGNSATAVNLCRNYSVTVGGNTYTNWSLPSVEELRKIHQAAPSYIYDLPSKYRYGVGGSDVAWIYYDTIYDRAVYIYTSSEVNSQMVNIWKHTTENFPVWKTDNFLVRAIRYF
jgi:hypothetical protein